jgi:GAF domain-containing protein
VHIEQKSRYLDIDSLHLIARDFAGASTLREILGAALDFIARLVRCDQCVVYVRQGADFVRWHRKESNPERSDIRITPELSAALSQHLAPIAVDKASATAKLTIFDGWSRNPGENFVCVPVVYRAQVLGAITIEHRVPHVFSRSEIGLLSTVGSVLGAAIRTSQLEDQNSTLRLELETQKLVARGKGILQRDLGMSEHEAYVALQRQSQEKKRSIKEIAQAIILSAEIRSNAVHAV